MTAIVRATDPTSPLSEELMDRLIDAVASGLKPRWVALLCGVAPHTLRNWLEMGSKRDALQPYRGFVFRWTSAEAELMKTHVDRWLTLQDSVSYAFLKERWPKWWGPKAEHDYEALAPTTSNADDMAVLRAILDRPEEFGLTELFREFDRLRPDGT